MTCDAPTTTEASCSAADGTWEVWGQLSCEPLPASAACDPRGHWQLTLTPELQTLSGQNCLRPTEHTRDLTIRAAQSGVLQVNQFAGQLTADGCQLWLSENIYWRNISEFGFNDLQIEVDLQGNEASGTFSFAASGFCNAQYRGLVRATRVADEPHGH
jgi:hypothetical protein